MAMAMAALAAGDDSYDGEADLLPLDLSDTSVERCFRPSPPGSGSMGGGTLLGICRSGHGSTLDDL